MDSIHIIASIFQLQTNYLGGVCQYVILVYSVIFIHMYLLS